MEENISQITSSSNNWNSLSSDENELILSYLPICSILRATAVCKLWYSLITPPSTFFPRVSASKKPWFFLYGQNSIFIKNNQSFAFDPESDEWVQLPVSPHCDDVAEQSVVGSGGFFFSTTTSKFAYSPLLKTSWRETSPLRFSRCNPLIGVFKLLGSIRFIVVGGLRYIGGLVDIEDRLAVEIYDPNLDSWDVCPSVPTNFRSGNSSQGLSSALFKGKFYVFQINSGFVSSFDLSLRFWSDVQMLRPSGILFSFLVSCRDNLVLAGLCNLYGVTAFKLWKVEEETMGFIEIGVMPQDLLNGLFDGGDEDDKFASLKCVGSGNSMYVFNEVHHKIYPACLCEIDGVNCGWRKLPDLPVPLNRFHKVISFCSTVSFGN